MCAVSLWLEDMCRCDGSKRVCWMAPWLQKRDSLIEGCERPGSAGAGAQRHLPGGSGTLLCR